MNRLLLLLLPLLLLPLATGCVGEQTRGAFTLRPPSRDDVPVYVADHSKEHEASLERALESSVRAQEAADDRDWTAREKASKVLAAIPAKPCVVHDLDNDTCVNAPKSPAE